MFCLILLCGGSWKISREEGGADIYSGLKITFYTPSGLFYCSKSTNMILYVLVFNRFRKTFDSYDSLEMRIWNMTLHYQKCSYDWQNTIILGGGTAPPPPHGKVYGCPKPKSSITYIHIHTHTIYKFKYTHS